MWETGVVEKIIYNVPDSEYSENWDPKLYPLIVKFKKNSIRIYPHDSISKSVMKRALTEKTMRTLPMGYPVLSGAEEHALRNEINAAVKAYSSKFI